MISPGRESGDVRRLLGYGRRLELATLGWNAIGIFLLAFAAITARSVALAGFGFDSLIEIGASTVVLWELAETGDDRQRRAQHIIGIAFMALAGYLLLQSILVLLVGFHPRHSTIGIIWTGLTAIVMSSLARAKRRTGQALANPVLISEGRVTFIDGLLAVAVLVGLALNSSLGAWWADPTSGLIIVFYAAKEAHDILSHR